MQQAAQQTTQVSSNLYQDFNVLQLRLDTQKLHRDILNFLEGKSVIVVFDEQKETFKEIEQARGTALANDEGIQNLLNFVVSTINSHTVQGNTDKNELYEILYSTYLHLAKMLMLNSGKWGIDNKNREHILETLMLMIRLFLSRTIGNEERKSYQPLIQKDTTQVIEKEKRKLI